MSTRIVAVAAVLVAPGCTPGPPATTPVEANASTDEPNTPRLEVLGGLLSFTPPRGAEVQPNVADGIMAAAPAVASQTRVRWRGVGVDGMVSFYRDLLPCEDDFESRVRPIVEEWSQDDGPFTLTRGDNPEVQTLIYRPEVSPGRDGILHPATAFICAGEAGLVEALVFVSKGGTRVENEALALIAGLRPGSASFDLPAHVRPMPEACGQREGQLHVPEGFAASESIGVDFEVVRVENVATEDAFASVSVYTGDHPKRFAPGDAESVVVETAEGVALERLQWQDERGHVHFEVIGNWPSTPCARHVWATAPDRATLDVLWRVLR